jgi:hypothetical protein
MNITKKIVLSCAGVLLAAGNAGAFAPTNFFEPYDPNLRLPICKSSFRLGVNAEYGDTSTARDWDGKKRNVLRIHDQAENVVAMLLGNQGVSMTGVDDFINANIDPMHIPAVTTNPASSDSAIAFDGDFRQFDATVYAEYKFPQHFLDGHFRFGAYLPIRDAAIRNVKFSEVTANIAGVHESLTKDITTFQNVINNWTPLDFGSWSKTGVGDLAMLLEWYRWFRQDRSGIKAVDLHFRVGMSAPTAEQRDINKAFSIPLGNDGAWGIPFGIGLGLSTKYKLKLGADATFLVLFDRTGMYRLKTDINQTEHVLLQTGRATKDHGLTWKFNLYAKGVNLVKGISLKAAYEYTKHDSDSLTSKTSKFNTSIINSANSLKEWNLHSLIFQVNWDSFRVKRDIPAKPQLSLFYKLPLGGKNIINPHTFGGQLAVNF